MLRDRLMVAGYKVVPFGEAADLGIINTCTVTAEADTKCRKAVRQFIRKNPQAFTAVIGCYAQMGAAAIAEIPGVDLIVGNHDKFSVLDYLHMGKQEQPLIARERISGEEFEHSFVGDLPFDRRANLKVQDGCDFMCSFCIIPRARGRARARQWTNCLEEARSAVARGIKELVLTGVNIGTYASEGRTLLDLVDALNDLQGLKRLRISSIEPTTVDEALFDRMAEPSHVLLPFLHLPLQSGSDAVLRLMRRKYSVRDYSEFVLKAVERVPGLCLGTDILVGFTGETEADFEATCEQFLQLPFAYCHVFPFSEREGTLVMQRAEGWVDKSERFKRVARLRRLSAHKRHAYMEAHLGRSMNVLLEDPRDGGFPGYTANYMRVRVEDPGYDIRNQMVRVRLERIRGDWVEGVIEDFLEKDDPQSMAQRTAGRCIGSVYV
jgi:threonylcarbamoyladenosine tRNA methylthiotransferase MtaB